MEWLVTWVDRHYGTLCRDGRVEADTLRDAWVKAVRRCEPFEAVDTLKPAGLDKRPQARY